MPGSPNIMKEFLVRLGYVVDDQSYKDFEKKLENTTQQFAELGKLVAATGVAIAASVLKASSSLEKLYFSSQRAGTSVNQLLGARLGGAQAGIGADELAGNIERMASSIRSNPGLLIFLNQLHVPISTDGVENFENLITKLRDLDAHGGGVMARLIGGQLGLDEQTLNTLFKNWPDYIRGKKEEAEILRNAGIDAEKLGKSAHASQVEWRIFLAHAEALEYLFAERVLPTLDKAVVLITRAAEAMFSLDKATDGWSTKIGGAVVALGGVWSSLKLIKGVAGFLGVGGAAEAGAGAAGGAGAAAGGSILAPLLVGIGDILLLINDIKQGKKLYDAYNSPGGETNKPSGSIQDLIAGYEGKRLKPYRDAGGYSIGYGHFIKPGEDFGGGISNQKALELLAKDTLEAAQTVQRLVKVHLSGNQFAALTDFAYNVGATKFADSTLLKKLNSGDYSGAADEFSRWNKVMTGDGLKASDSLTQRRLGERNLFTKPDVKIEQNTQIHVMGNDDPRATGRAIAEEQRRVNGTLLRDMQGAVN